jgi:hypothetical protein
LGELNDWRRLDQNVTGGGASRLIPIVISLTAQLLGAIEKIIDIIALIDGVLFIFFAIICLFL